VIGIIFLAVLTLGTLRYATYISHERQRQAALKAKEAGEHRKSETKQDHNPALDASEILASN
jgi:hypothetical protein